MSIYKIIEGIFFIICGIYILSGQFSTNNNYGIVVIGLLIIYWGVKKLISASNQVDNS